MWDFYLLKYKKNTKKKIGCKAISYFKNSKENEKKK
jgi:hypothetical protein